MTTFRSPLGARRALSACAALTTGAIAAAITGATLERARADGDLDGETILRRAESEHRAKDERGVVDVALVTEDGLTQRRSMEMLFKAGDPDDDLHLLRFLEPETIRGTALLTLEASDRNDDQWVYLPALKRTKKIAASRRSERFAQTDFTYEDLRTEDFARHTYRRLDDAALAGVPCFQIEATPRTAEDSGYSRRVVTVEKARFLTLKVEYFDAKGRHQKTLLNRDFEKHAGLWRPKQAMMDDHLRRSKTLWRFVERQLNAGLPASTFTVQNLERGS